MNAKELNEMHNYARNCPHSDVEYDEQNGKMECMDCGLSGTMRWSHIISIDEMFVDTDETPMGVMIVKRGEHG